jgi:hypothetical protein
LNEKIAKFGTRLYLLVLQRQEWRHHQGYLPLAGRKKVWAHSYPGLTRTGGSVEYDIFP